MRRLRRETAGTLRRDRGTHEISGLDDRLDSGALTFIGVYQRRDRDSHHIGAADLCRMLIADCELYSAPALRERLEHLGIRSSIDIGNIVYELIAEGMCTAGENDSKSDFDTLFNAENFDSYIASLQLRRDGRRVVRSAAVWTLYVAAVVSFFAFPSSRNAPYIFGAFVTVGFLLSKARIGCARRFGLAWSNLRHRPLASSTQTTP